jgi:hypothetical protein
MYIIGKNHIFIRILDWFNAENMAIVKLIEDSENKQDLS